MLLLLKKVNVSCLNFRNKKCFLLFRSCMKNDKTCSSSLVPTNEERRSVHQRLSTHAQQTLKPKYILICTLNIANTCAVKPK
ncbi:CLUMA_CG000562, isoform A [Clunio marinus]|uniref:CLUMA_CG000562, isoform A n=1 Tax=Clunio marinus TaxID=568069 RepID=A0A1J1HKG1_9DIPT|nr:CLUMA_CG000562, isoform A [Clunio marinus]